MKEQRYHLLVDGQMMRDHFLPHPIQQVQWHSELTGSLGT
jgi:hypothetical protein